MKEETLRKQNSQTLIIECKLMFLAFFSNVFLCLLGIETPAQCAGDQFWRLSCSV